MCFEHSNFVVSALAVELKATPTEQAPPKSCGIFAISTNLCVPCCARHLDGQGARHTPWGVRQPLALTHPPVRQKHRPFHRAQTWNLSLIETKIKVNANDPPVAIGAMVFQISCVRTALQHQWDFLWPSSGQLFEELRRLAVSPTSNFGCKDGAPPPELLAWPSHPS